jgi:hypothetical protein
MKRIAFTLLFGALWGTALPAQTPAKPANTPASPSAAAPAVSDHDLNIRAYIELLRADIRNERTQIVGEVMQLDAGQAAAFWPIYKKFETDYTAIGNQIVDLVKTYTANYSDMTPAVADQLATKLLDIEQQRNSLKRTYYAKFKAALGPITSTRFLQVENQLEKLLDLQIAAELPVIRESER